MRVAKVVQQKVKKYVDEIAPDLVDKCTLCNSTLSHLVKTGEVATDAPQATVVKALVERFNEKAAQGDKVTVKAINNRIDRHAKPFMSPNRGNKVEEVARRLRRDRHSRESLAAGERKRATAFRAMAKLKIYQGFLELPERIQWDLFEERHIEQACRNINKQKKREAARWKRTKDREEREAELDKYFESMSEEEREEYEKARLREKEEEIRRHTEKMEASIKRFLPGENNNHPAVSFFAEGMSLLDDSEQDGMLSGVYRLLSKKLHPDSGGDPEKFKKLSDMRARY